jgi:tRNA nucleotidyltransferase/poly(A) polymerase
MKPIPENRPTVAPAVTELARRIEQSGQRAWLVGETVHALVRGDVVGTFLMATDAPTSQVLRLFPTAVPTRTREKMVAIPTPAGPVDLVELRHGPLLEEDLAHRDFTVNAMALELPSGLLIDPFGGAEDVTARRLRTVGSSAASLEEAPLRALRAACHLSLFRYHPDPELEAALSAGARSFAGIPTAVVRGELLRLLSGPHADEAVGLLHSTSLESQLIPEANPLAAGMIARLPNDRLLRLVAWLPRSKAPMILARWRIEPGLSREIQQLLECHPLDERVRPRVDHSVMRLRDRVDDDTLEKLFTLRSVELEILATQPGADRGAISRARDTLDALREAIRRVDALARRRQVRASLALDGREVMRALGCGPGREVGAALRVLTEQVERDPSCNTREKLLRCLKRWKARDDDSPDETG